jgi:hypothetical protein
MMQCADVDAQSLSLEIGARQTYHIHGDPRGWIEPDIE